MTSPPAPETSPRDRLLIGCMAALSLLVVVPFWTGEYLPFLDIPQHLATIGVMHHFADPSFGFATAFTLDTTSTQYLLYYLTCDALADVMGVENANRVFLSVYATLLPLSLWYCLRAFGRLQCAALLAYPLVFHRPLFMGFINYAFALPFFFLGLGLMQRAVAAGSDGLGQRCRREVWLTLCGLAVFYSHLQILLVYLGGLGLVVLFHWPGVRGALLRLAHLLPTLLLFGLWLLQTDGLAGGAAWQETVRQRYATLAGPEWESPLETLSGFSQRLLGVYREGADEVLTMILVGILLTLFAVRRIGEASPRLRDFAPEALTLCVLVFYFVVPTRYDWVWPVNWRFAPLFVLLLLLWARGAWHPRARQVVTIAFALFATWSCWVHIRNFRAFDQEARQVNTILDAIDDRARVYALVYDNKSLVVDNPAYTHFVQYHQLRKGGVAAFSFAEAPQSPIRFRSPGDGGPRPTKLYSEWRPREFRYQDVGDYYDYFLVRGGSNVMQMARFPRDRVTKVAQAGMWRLFRNRRGM